MTDESPVRAGHAIPKRSGKSISQLLRSRAVEGKSGKRQSVSQIRLPPLAVTTQSARFLPVAKLVPKRALHAQQRSAQFPAEGISIKDYACLSKQGRLQHTLKFQNQDASLVVKDVAGLADSYLFAVFDGHGPFGHRVSGFLKEQFRGFLESALADTPGCLSTALKSSFRAISKGLRRTDIDCTYSGSTCLSVLVKGSQCLCSYVGDSRAVLGRQRHGIWKAVQLSVDHKPTLPEEYTRIVNSGGAISPCYSSAGTPRGPLRVWLKNQHFPGLAMTRSIGDSLASQAGVSSEPQLTQFELTTEDRLLVLASDGLWEVSTNEEVVSFLGAIYDTCTCAQACESLMRETVNRWVRISESRDDVTVLVVYLA